MQVTPIPTIALTGVNSTENPGPGIGIAECLRAAFGRTINIIALAYDARECATLVGPTALIDQVYLLPYPRLGPQAQLEQIIAIHQKHPIELLIPSLDAELPSMIRNAPRLQDHGIRTLLPTEPQFTGRAKDQLPQLAEQLNLACPKTHVIQDPTQLKDAAREIGFPAIVKGQYYDSTSVNDFTSLCAAADKIVAKWGYPILIQQPIAGFEVNLAGLADGHGRLQGSVAIRKESCTANGKVWTATTISNPTLNQAAEHLAQRLKWRGPFEIECMVDESGTLHLIEINPRFPAWINAGALLGVNLPAELIHPTQTTLTPPPSGKWYTRRIIDEIADTAPLEQLITQGYTQL